MDFYVDDIGKYLKENGIKPSYQRIRIFKYLMERNNHPTVDMIYKYLCPEMPTLSKTTVYNTLNLFVDKKIVDLIVIEENETRYDISKGFHGHFKCTRCGNIYDIDMEKIKTECEDLLGCHIEEQHLYFKGLCPVCSRTSTNN